MSPTDESAFAALDRWQCHCGAPIRIVSDPDGERIVVLAQPDPAGDLEIIAWDSRAVYAAPVDERSTPEDIGLRIRSHAHA